MKRKFLVLTQIVLSLLFLYSCEQKDEIIWRSDSNTKEVLLSGDYIENVVRLKFSSEMVEPLKFSLKSGSIRSNNEEIDRVMVSCGIEKLKRTFPPSGKYEERSRKEGLHLWYDVTFDSSNVTLENVIDEFGSLNDVEVTEPVKKIKLAKGKWPITIPIEASETNITLIESSSMPFNDPYLSSQWHYYNDGSVTDGISGADINLFNGWLKETGSKDVIVSIVDGGIDIDHEDLNENIWVNEAEYNGLINVDDDKNGYVDDVYGYNFVNGSGIIKAHDHGTHVAGTIGAINNNGIGVCGVAGGNGTHSGVRLMSCQVFSVDENGEETSAQSFAEAIKYGADNGAVISQNSWGYEDADYLPLSMKEAIDYFNKYAGVDENDAQFGPMKGGVVIFAAGNEDLNVAYPASYDGVIAVAGMAPDYSKAYYSNYGSWVDITAPGGSVAHGDLFDNDCMVMSTIPDNRYGYMQGTSMACPHVSGVAALIVSRYGDLGFTSELLRWRLALGSINIYDYNSIYINKLGVGLINSAGVLSNIDNKAPETVTGFDVSVLSNTIEVNWVVNSDPDDIKPYGYYVYYSTSSFNEEDIEKGSDLIEKKAINVSQLNVGDAVSLSLSGLNFETTYYFAIVGYDYLMATSHLSPLVTGVTGVNRAPLIVPDEPFNNQIKAHEVVMCNFTLTDPENHELSWSFVDISKNSSAQAIDGGVCVIINGMGGDAGAYSATLTATDEYGASSDYLLEYTILPNNAPSLIKEFDNLYIGKASETTTINLNDYFTDVDEELLSYSVSFNSSITEAFVNQQVLTITTKSLGLSEITVTAQDARGETVSGTFKVMVRDNSQVVDVYPNPVVDYLNIRMGEDVTGTVKVEVINSSGVKVVTDELSISPFAPARIDLSSLSSGSYIVRVVYNDIDVKRNFIKL